MAPRGVVNRPRRAPLASVLEISNEKGTHSVYQEKIHAPAIFKPTHTTQTEMAMLKALPFSFLGLTAAKPMEIRRSVQTLKMSIDFPSDISAFGVLSGRKAPTFVATGLSKSTVPGALR